MNEITKLYENAEVNQICDTFAHWMQCEWKTRQCEDCEHFVYPPFTAEKQLELIKFFSKREDFALDYYLDCWRVKTDFRFEYYDKYFEHKDFEQALAGLINTLWQSLTEEERKQIKNILEE